MKYIMGTIRKQQVRVSQFLNRIRAFDTLIRIKKLQKRGIVWEDRRKKFVKNMFCGR